MFQKTELEDLRLRKERLVARSEANRRALAAELQRFQSRDWWLSEAGDFFRRHPWWVISLAAAAGTMTVKTLRRPRTVFSRVRDLGKTASLVLSVWKLFGRKK